MEGLEPSWGEPRGIFSIPGLEQYSGPPRRDAPDWSALVMDGFSNFGRQIGGRNSVLNNACCP